jgi:hypothetical protein
MGKERPDSSFLILLVVLNQQWYRFVSQLECFSITELC